MTMKLLFLGPADSPLIPYLRRENLVTVIDEVLSTEYVRSNQFHFLISYGYRHILKPEILALFDSRAINLHISCLPWNRGADPNFWSFVDETPKGVSIHHLDSGVDTGDLIAQREVGFDEHETLRTSYAKLKSAIERLFLDTWPLIQAGTAPRSKQPAGGSVHRVRDKEALAHLLTEGLDTPVSKLRRSA